MRPFQDLQGKEVTLGRFLGRGGEGAVYSVSMRPRLVAKIYVRTPDDHMGRKLAAMVQLGTEALTSLAAWPQDLLHDDRTGNVVGFLMPRVEDHRGIHVLYGPTHRKTAFPDATWAFLVRAACNLAATFDTVHDHGHVIGDVNEGNIVVSQKATVRLIDCDSFQITHLGRNYPCRVGVPLYTPPELQGKRLEDIVRTPDHDRFGLAVLVFQLLFMGRHPFAGLHPERAIPVGMAIREGLFAFGQEAARQGWEPPPFSLRLTEVSSSLSQLFERAFGKDAATGGPRPTAAEWVTALGDLEAKAVICSQDPRHVKVNGSCPWCRIEKEGGPFFYLPPRAAAPESRRRDILTTWEALAQLSHFEMLGVSESASEQEIKQAFFRKAKKFHPDQYGDPSFSDIADKIEAIFMRVSGAYEVLRDPQRRASYEGALRRQRTTGNPAPLPDETQIIDTAENAWMAEEALHRADGLIAAGKVWDAIRLLTAVIPRIHGHKQRDRARVFLAKAYIKNPNWLRRGEELLQQVIQEDPQNAEAYLALGMLYKETGMSSRAVSMFKKGLALKSGNKAEVPPGGGPAARELFEKIGGLVLKARESFAALESKLTAKEREWVLDAIDRVKTLAGGEVEELRRCEEALTRAMRLLEAVRRQH